MRRSWLTAARVVVSNEAACSIAVLGAAAGAASGSGIGVAYNATTCIAVSDTRRIAAETRTTSRCSDNLAGDIRVVKLKLPLEFFWCWMVWTICSEPCEPLPDGLSAISTEAKVVEMASETGVAFMGSTTEPCVPLPDPFTEQSRNKLLDDSSRHIPDRSPYQNLGSYQHTRQR